jgi:hypothetical protein
MKTYSEWKMLLAAIAMTLPGCKSGRSIGAWCSVSAHFDGTHINNMITYAVVFEEFKGVITARMVQCGEKEYYVGSSDKASSLDVLTPGYRQSDMRWDGTLTCNDIRAAYQDDSSETRHLVKSLCSILTGDGA